MTPILSRTGQQRVPLGVLAAVVGACGFLGLVALCNVNAMERFAEIDSVIDRTVVIATTGTDAPIAMDAPGTRIEVSPTEGGRTTVGFSTVSQEVCFFAWLTLAPLSQEVVFYDGRGGLQVLSSNGADADEMALTQCAGFANGKQVVFTVLTT